MSLQNMWLYNAAAEGDVEWARKCISDGANVNDQHEVSYDVYHIEGSVVNEVFFTCTHTLHIIIHHIPIWVVVLIEFVSVTV